MFSYSDIRMLGAQYEKECAKDFVKDRVAVSSYVGINIYSF